MDRSYRSALAFVVVITSCKGGMSKLTGEETDAAAARDAATTAAATPIPEGANLLQIVPSKVAVSSTVDNPRDFPEHIMDGRMETAWNGKTGDLGGSIYFRVPKDAHVDRVELTVGFDAVNAKHDLFTANHRIKKVAVWRDDAKLGEVDLDANKRGWHKIPVGAAGGDFRLQVLETVPGTEKSWKEIVVSEMKVIGRPGKERRRPDEPIRIAVGTLDSSIDTTLPPDLKRSTLAAQAEMAALCAQWVKEAEPRWKSYVANPDPESPIPHDPEAKKKPPSCREIPFAGKFTGDATWKSVRAIRAGYGGAGMTTYLVAELRRGFVLTPIAWNAENANPMGCPSTVIAADVPEVRVENGYLVAVVDGIRETMVSLEDMDPEPGDSGWRALLLRGVAWCKDTGKDITCEHQDPQFGESLGEKIQPHATKHTPWAKLAWRPPGLATFQVTPDGKLVVKQPKAAGDAGK